MSIFDYIQKVEEKLVTVDGNVQKQLFDKLNISFQEQTKYLDINAQSFASGVIDLETSNFIYQKLSNYSNTKLSERMAITQVMMELLKKRLKH